MEAPPVHYTNGIPVKCPFCHGTNVSITTLSMMRDEGEKRRFYRIVTPEDEQNTAAINGVLAHEFEKDARLPGRSVIMGMKCATNGHLFNMVFVNKSDEAGTTFQEASSDPLPNPATVAEAIASKPPGLVSTKIPDAPVAGELKLPGGQTIKIHLPTPEQMNQSLCAHSLSILWNSVLEILHREWPIIHSWAVAAQPLGTMTTSKSENKLWLDYPAKHATLATAIAMKENISIIRSVVAGATFGECQQVGVMIDGTPID